MDTGFPASGPRQSFGPKARAMSQSVVFESRSAARPRPPIHRSRPTLQSEQGSDELSDVPQYDKMAGGERFPVSVFIALLLSIGGVIGLIALAIAG
jgi:hypothetical protein